MLPQENRLNPNQFKTLYNQGRKIRGEYGMLLTLRNNERGFRIGFVVSKKIGNAVQRHRMTRLLREITKKYIKEINNIDAIYIAYKYCNEYQPLYKDFDKQIKTAISNTKES